MPTSVFPAQITTDAVDNDAEFNSCSLTMVGSTFLYHLVCPHAAGLQCEQPLVDRTMQVREAGKIDLM